MSRPPPAWRMRPNSRRASTVAAQMPRCCMRARACGLRCMGPRLRGGDGIRFDGGKRGDRVELGERTVADALEIAHDAEEPVLHASKLRLALFPDARHRGL